MKKKTFYDLKVGDEIYKVHLDFEHDKCDIETKIIKSRDVSLHASRENMIVFYFDNFTLSSLSNFYEAYCELDKRLSIQHYFECHDMLIQSHKSPNGEYVYYATNKEDIEDIVKLKMIEHINSLVHQRNHINEKIEKLRKFYDSFKFC